MRIKLLFAVGLLAVGITAWLAFPVKTAKAGVREEIDELEKTAFMAGAVMGAIMEKERPGFYTNAVDFAQEAWRRCQEEHRKRQR